ncbi:MAG: DegT/DnrJ/EryC1/StrS family aminotransferase [Clostridia bacterium]|nr:DegT/DnrJ/EryC1/StrS family aminotransferase [Clostridia bacterium]
MEVLSGRLDRLFERRREEYEQKALDILRSGQYILGEEVDSFEKAFALFNGAKYCVGVGSGLDALRISLRMLGVGEGDEVIVQGNTFIAGVMAVADCGAVPVLVDPGDGFNLDAESVRSALTEKTRAVLVTHLYGIPTNMDGIVRLCKERGLLLIEDCAHAHGAQWRGKKVGTFGDAGCFSFYPTKNLGCFGDGGAVITNNAEFAEKVRLFRCYGSEVKYHHSLIGANSLLDALQAGMLGIKLQSLDETNAERTAIAEKYSAEIKNPLVVLPKAPENAKCVWHQYVVRCSLRDRLQRHLEENGIHTIIHYPVPAHLTEAFAYLGIERGSLPKTEELSDTVLSLPMYNGMTDSEQDAVIEAVNSFSG